MKLVFEDIENLHNFTSCPDVNPSGIKRFTYGPLINEQICISDLHIKILFYNSLN